MRSSSLSGLVIALTPGRCAISKACGTQESRTSGLWPRIVTSSHNDVFPVGLSLSALAWCVCGCVDCQCACSVRCCNCALYARMFMREFACACPCACRYGAKTRGTPGEKPCSFLGTTCMHAMLWGLALLCCSELACTVSRVSISLPGVRVCKIDTHAHHLAPAHATSAVAQSAGARIRTVA